MREALRKKGGPKMKVSLAMLLKTNIEKMSVLMVSHDIDEIK